MARKTTRFRRVATMVPLALVSAAWTTHLAGAGPAALGPVGSATPEPQVLPDGTRLPGAPIDYPASLSASQGVVASDGRFTPVVAAPSSSDIPPGALAAYQRAETVINAADPSCRLSWQLLAAIGRVESDHGRFGGAVPNAEGASVPAIVGPVLDGRNGTAVIRDTDAGQYDGDMAYDRAVGPMQFIPSTWAAVGVDADNDGERNPQDIDDAALAAAVYLCSGEEDLGTVPGRESAVHRYNHSDAYVDLVLAIMDGYLEGDFTTNPTTILNARSSFVGPTVPGGGLDLADGLEADAAPLDTPTVGAQLAALGAPTVPPTTGADPVAPGTDPTGPTDPTDTPTDLPTDLPTEEPTDEPTEGTTDPADPTDPTSGPTTDPTEPTEPTEPAEPTETTDPTEPAEPTEPTESTEPAEGSLTADEAAEYCGEDQQLVDDPASETDQYDVCVDTYAVPSSDEPSDVPPTPNPSTAALREESATRG